MTGPSMPDVQERVAGLLRVLDHNLAPQNDHPTLHIGGSVYDQLHEARDLLRLLERQAEAVQEKATLWDGLMGMARIRPLGWAGMDGRTGEPEELDYYGNPNNGYAHLGVELWTIYPDFSEHESEVATHERGRVLLTTMARLSAALASAEVNDER